MRLKLNHKLSLPIMAGLMMAVAVMLLLAVPVSAKVIKGEADAKAEADMKEYTEKIGKKDGEHVLVPIKGGEVLVGSPESEEGRKEDEGPQIKVKIEPFWMGKYEVTWDAYQKFREELNVENKTEKNVRLLPWDKQADAVSIPTPLWEQESGPILAGMGESGGYPAADISQYAARQFTKWLSKKTGKFYRLPTEAEWEYAARAGTTTPYYFGADADKLGEHGIFYDNSEYDDPSKGHPDTGTGYRKVGSKGKANAWGLYDMHGNVSEWTLDEYRADHFAKLKTKYGTKTIPYFDAIAWPTKDIPFPHVAKGGNWDADAERCRVAARLMSTPELQKRDPQLPKSIWWYTDSFHIGFRIVRPLKVPSKEEQLKYWQAKSDGILHVLKTNDKSFRTMIEQEK